MFVVDLGPISIMCVVSPFTFQAYLDYMTDVAVFLGASSESSARTEMKDVLLFEMSLANFSLPREERRNATKLYNPMRIKDLAKFDPNTPWLEYINNILTPEIIQVGIRTREGGRFTRVRQIEPPAAAKDLLIHVLKDIAAAMCIGP